MTKLTKALNFFLLLLFIVSCNNEPETNFTLKGTIKDLKKGVVYLQKDGDSTNIIDLDSMVIQGQPEFTLQTNIEEPLLLYLKLFKNDRQEHFVPFFADKGIMEINTSLKNFNYDAKVTGSKQQEILNEYLDMMSKFNNKNLDLLKATFDAQKANDSILTDSLTRQSQRLLRQKYGYTINFAVRNNTSEVAPYLALYEIPNTSVRYLDTIYNSLTDSIKQSLYGKRLGDALVKLKAPTE